MKGSELVIVGVSRRNLEIVSVAKEEKVGRMEKRDMDTRVGKGDFEGLCTL